MPPGRSAWSPAFPELFLRARMAFLDPPGNATPYSQDPCSLLTAQTHWAPNCRPLKSLSPERKFPAENSLKAQIPENSLEIFPLRMPQSINDPVISKINIWRNCPKKFLSKLTSVPGGAEVGGTSRKTLMMCIKTTSTPSTPQSHCYRGRSWHVCTMTDRESHSALFIIVEN